MATLTESDDLRGAQFSDVNLSGSKFVRSDLSGAVMRGVYVERVGIDAPWLLEDQRIDAGERSGCGSTR